MTSINKDKHTYIGIHTQTHKKKKMRGWRYDLVIKSTCSFRGSEFNFQYPHGVSQPSVIPVPETLCPLWPINIHASKTLMLIFKKKKLKLLDSRCMQNAHFHF